MFFDRDEEGRETLRDALQHRDPGVSPIETLRLLAHRLIAEQRPYVEFSERSQSFVATVERSDTLKARARAIRDELTQVAAVALAESVGRDADRSRPCSPCRQYAAGRMGSGRLHPGRTGNFRQTQDTSDRQHAAFHTIVDRGAIGLKAAMAGAPPTPELGRRSSSLRPPLRREQQQRQDAQRAAAGGGRRPAAPGDSSRSPAVEPMAPPMKDVVI